MSQLPSFFGTRGHKKFNYQPMYYDERKEEREQRNRQIEKEMGIENDDIYTPRIRKGQMSGLYRRTQRKAERQSNIRLVILIVFLVLVAWLIFFR